MATKAEFDPLKVSRALTLLASELEAELMREAPAEAAFRLRLELARVVLGARRWAERHGVPVACIPDPPDQTASTQECLAALHRLAAALNYLGFHAAPSGTMRRIIEWLRLHDDGALGEVEDLRQAIEELARALISVEATAAVLCEDLERIASSPEIAAAQARAAEMHDVTNVVLGAFEELRSGLLAWAPVEESEAREI